MKGARRLSEAASTVSSMRLLHTSDWHLGRHLHGHDLAAAQSAFVDHLVEVAVSERIDAVLVSGDVHDRALPPESALRTFADALQRLRDAGTEVVVISGNHDSAARLGDKAGLLDRRISLRTDPRRLAEPVLLSDQHGEVAVYGLPYLEPAAVRGLVPGVPVEPESDDPVERGAHGRVLRQALTAVHADRAGRGRSVVLAHAFVTGGTATDSERDISVGGIGDVPARLFDGIDYTALGHLHRPQTLRPGLRYSGSPLPYSFSEASHVKTSFLVELDATGLSRVEEVPTPVHRRLQALSGTLEELLHSREFDGAEQDFVALRMTDPVRPMEAMSRLQRRYTYPLTLSWDPSGDSGDAAGSYAARTVGLSDTELAHGFVDFVRSAPTASEQGLLAQALESARLSADPDQDAA